MSEDKDAVLSQESWRLFRIIAEFVDGFEVIRKERDRHWQLLLRKP